MGDLCLERTPIPGLLVLRLDVRSDDPQDRLLGLLGRQP